MCSYKILKNRKLQLTSSICLLIFSTPAHSLTTPLVVSNNDNLVFNNDSIHIITNDSTRPIEVKGGKLSIENSSFLIRTTNDGVDALTIGSSDYTTKVVTIKGSANQKAVFETTGNASNAISISAEQLTTTIDHAKIHASGKDSRGVNIFQKRSDFNISNSEIKSHGTGIMANAPITNPNARIIVNVNNTTIESLNFSGITMLGANLNADNFTITVGKNPFTGASDATTLGYGIKLDTHSKAVLNNGAITTWQNYSDGIWLVGAGGNFNTDFTDITAVDVTTHGMQAHGINSQGKKVLIRDSSIHTYGNTSYGIAAGLATGSNTAGMIDISNSTITTEGQNALGTLANDRGTLNIASTNIVTSGDGATGARSVARGRINIADASQITTSGADAHGVDIAHGSLINITESSVDTTGTDSHGVYMRGYNTPNGVPADLHKNVATITDSVVSSAKGSAIAVRGGSENTITIKGSSVSASSPSALFFSADMYRPSIGGNVVPMSVGTVNLTADSSNLTGNSLINSGTVDFKLSNNSVWTGAALVGDNNRVLHNLTLDETSRWIINDNSTVQSLTNKGTVEFAALPGKFKSLTILDDYHNDDGRFILTSQLGFDNSPTDTLIFKKDVSGDIELKVVNVGGNGAQTVEGIPIVFIEGTSTANFALKGDYVHEGEQAVVGGLYAYKLREGSVSDPNNGNLYLRSVKYKDPPIEPPIKPLFNAGVPIYEAYPQLLLGLNALPTMQQRVGNRYWSNAGNRSLAQGADSIEAYVPNSEAGTFNQNNGVWGRIEGSHTKVKPRFSTSETSYDFNSFKLQAGLDGMLNETETGKLIGGVTVHYTHGQMDVESVHGKGDIKTDGYGFGGTLTWYGDNGFYVDGQGQLTWYRSDLYSSTAKKNLADGKNNGFGYALSIETGQHIAIDDHWSVTPQAQLQYSNVDFDDFTTRWESSKTDVAPDKGDSLRGRLSVSLDYQNAWQNAQGTTNRSIVYGIANLYNEFLDGTRVNLGTKAFANKQERLWGGIGLGGSYNWNDDKYSLYGEGSVNTSLNHFGDSYTYKGTVGLRVKW